MKAKRVRKLSLAEAAYLAGLIDGEGTITLTRKQKNAQRHLSVNISNTERYLLEYSLKIIGAGKITSKKTYKKNHSPAFTYQIYSRQALDVLAQIKPFLCSYKKRRAALALNKYILLTPRNGKYTIASLKKRNKFDRQLLAIVPQTKTPH